jgi:ABC-type nitrate/sulfonate/bicarbonate transport system substrate-binding protein
LIDQRPDLVARWLARVIEAGRWAKTNRDESFRIVAAESGVAEETAHEAFGEGLPDQLVPDLSDENIAAIVSQKDFLLANGFIKRDFDIEQFIVRGPLAEANQIINRKDPNHDNLPTSRQLDVNLSPAPAGK